MKQLTEGKYLCYRQWDSCHVFYVAQVPGDCGADWGYTDVPSKALPLNEYFMRRFKADCGRVGAHALIQKIA